MGAKKHPLSQRCNAEVKTHLCLFIYQMQKVPTHLKNRNFGTFSSMRITGLEPARQKTPDPKSGASANSAISASYPSRYNIQTPELACPPDDRRHVSQGTTGPAGFEPANAGVKVLCLTAWRWPIIYIKPPENPSVFSNK